VRERGGQERFGPKAVFIASSQASDMEDVYQAFLDWMNMLEEAGYPVAQQSQEARAMLAATDYLAGVYDNFHALHLHNRLRNGNFEAHVAEARDGLGRLPDDGYVAILDEALKIFHDHRHAWDNWPGGNSDEHRAAKALMAPADNRFTAIDNLKTWDDVGRAILALPTVRIVSDEEWSHSRDALVAASPTASSKLAEKQARDARRRDEMMRASEIRAQNALNDPVNFAADFLAKRAGYTDVYSVGHRQVLEDSRSARWELALRTDDGQQQINWLVEFRNEFALFDYSFETVRARAPAADIERERRKRLGLAPDGPKPASPFGRIFGRKK